MYDHFDGGIGMSNYIGRGIDQIDNVSTLDNLSFNGSDATFNLTQNSTAFTPVSADALQIQIDGIIQSGNYTVSGSTVTFDFTPSGSSVCNGIKHFGVGLLTTPTDGSVTATKIGTDAVIQAKIGDEAVDEARLQISNAPTNGYFLSAQSGNTGGLTWASATPSVTPDNCQYFILGSNQTISVNTATTITGWGSTELTARLLFNYGTQYVTHSSGIFSFSTEGYYKVAFRSSGSTTGASSGNAYINSTTNNSSYADAVDVNFSNSASGGFNFYMDGIFKITDTTNHKLSTSIYLPTNGGEVAGNTTRQRTYIRFQRLGTAS
mgnify:CR=1 FL=1